MSWTKNLVIGCAIKEEAAALGAELGDEYTFLVTGIGPVRTEKTLRKFFQSQRPTLLLFTGTAGQLDPAWPMSQVVCPQSWGFNESWYEVESKLCDQLRQAGWEVSGRGITVSRPVVQSSSRVELYQRNQAGICDMESGIALKLAAECGVPCLAVKIISDTAESGILGFWKEFDQNMLKLAASLKELLLLLTAIDE